MARIKVDREKTKRLNALVLKGINEIRGNQTLEGNLEKLMKNSFNILEGETRKVILTQNIDELKLSLKHMLLISLYQLTNNDDYNLEPFYKSKLKLKFLHRYPNNTQIPYARIFEYSNTYEEDYKKDLSEFTLYELENVLTALRPLTESASHVNGRIITAYIEWCVDNNDNNSTNVKENELKNKPVNYFKRFVDDEVQLFFTKRDIEGIVWDCYNPQDAVIIALLFEGVQGKSLAEIRNIKKEHVLQAKENDNVLVVYNEENKQRKVRLEDFTIKLLVEASERNEYAKKNNNIENENLGAFTNLVINDYVIRTSITRTDFSNRPVDKMVIYRRIKTISEYIDNPSLTAKNIVRSGVIYEAQKKLANKKELTKEDYLDICSKYNIENWYPVKKYCSPQIIKELYSNQYSVQEIL